MVAAMAPTRTIKWNFEPFLPYRPDVAAEVVLVKRWQKMMGGVQQKHDLYFVENYPEKYPIIGVLAPYYPNARDTRITASFMRWLGAGLGQSFLYEGDRLRDQFEKTAGLWPRDAYVAQWAIENRRIRNVNSGRMPRDMVMEPEKMTVRDIEIMERMATWLGEDDGQAFIAGCRHNLKIKRERAHQARAAARRPI